MLAVDSAFSRTRLPTLDLAADAVLLDGVQDPGNVGTLLRTAAAAGVRQVLAVDRACAAAWSPKVLRAGQGAHFVLDIVEDADLDALLSREYRGHGCRDLPGWGDQFLFMMLVWQGPLAWVFGAEGLGVSPALIAAADHRIKIPMPGAVESLNVGAAAADLPVSRRSAAAWGDLARMNNAERCNTGVQLLHTICDHADEQQFEFLQSPGRNRFDPFG